MTFRTRAWHNNQALLVWVASSNRFFPFLWCCAIPTLKCPGKSTVVRITKKVCQLDNTNVGVYQPLLSNISTYIFEYFCTKTEDRKTEKRQKRTGAHLKSNEPSPNSFMLLRNRLPKKCKCF